MSESPAPDLQIVETRVYRGANVWSYDRSIHLVVDLGSLEEFPTNTLPGFTRISMYPRLWEISGLPPARLVDRLVDGAIRRHRDRRRLDSGIKDFLAELSRRA